MKELLIIIVLVFVGTKCAQFYNQWEEPLASRALRSAGIVPY